VDVEELRGELRELGADRFVRRYGRYFLVVTDRALLEEMSMFVNTASRPANEIATRRNLDHAAFLPLLDAERGTGEGRIDVGRDEACAVALTHQSISKVHAHFTYSGGLLSLSDAGSKNGTKLNGVKLGPNEVAPVDLGDTVEFGPVSATVWGIDDLVAAVGDAR
jgi:hypothetical protein